LPLVSRWGAERATLGQFRAAQSGPGRLVAGALTAQFYSGNQSAQNATFLHIFIRGLPNEICRT
jgi:hypothetical protein